MKDETARKIGPYHRLLSEVKYQNRWITVTEDRVIRPGGSEGIFGVVSMVAGSSVVVLDDRQHTYLVREYKYGIQRVTLEIMSGAIEKEETPLQAATRELREELGLEAKHWTELGMVDPFTTVVRSPNYMFLACDITHVQAEPDEGEELSVVKLPFSQALDMVLEGQITHAASCVAILKTARILHV